MRSESPRPSTRSSVAAVLSYNPRRICSQTSPTMNAIEPDYARLRALYRTPPVPRCGNVLELCLPGRAVLNANDWPTGTLTQHEVVAGKSPPAGLPANTYDYIVAHDLLDRLNGDQARHMAHKALLGQARDALVSGGTIAGCVANRFAVSRLFRGGTNPPGAVSVFSLARALRECGLRDIEIYNLFRHPNLPRFAFNVKPVFSPREARHHLDSVRPFLSRRQYLLRTALVVVGMNPFVEDTLWFWARKT